VARGSGQAQNRPVNTGPHTLSFVWITRLRWAAIFGQLAAMLVAEHALRLTLPWPTLLCILGCVAGTNLAVTRRVRRAAHARPGGTGPEPGERTIFQLMVFDVCALTALLAFTGGPVNPFNFLYLVELTLAALVLSPRHIWALVALSIAGFGALFFPPLSEASAGFSHSDLMRLHLRGMWVAFAVAAVFIVYFVQGVLRALAARDAELTAARERAVRSERLVALAGLAAGAAHELATPLGTVVIACRELELALERLGDARGDALRDDVHLIREQADRCRSILDRMSLEAGASTGEAAMPLPLAALVAEAVDGLDAASRCTVDISPELLVRAFPRASVQGLRNVLDNALKAAPAGTRVSLSATATPTHVALTVTDQGPGIPVGDRDRIGEPFYSTRAPGQGAGLGLFLARAVAEALGGGLEVACPPSGGTRVTLIQPRAPV
jgi:two-component system sensor histidine kinase RegB